MIYSFISLPFCPDPDPQIYADPDPGRAKTCGSGSETLVLTIQHRIYWKEGGSIYIKIVVLLEAVHTRNFPWTTGRAVILERLV